jgi:hypothetical protein
LAGGGGPEFSERPVLELADPFGADAEPAGDFAQALGVAVETETGSEYGAFAFA